MNIEIEEQRPGRDKNTLINHTYISSGEYKRKFDSIANNKELSRLLYQIAKDMLDHRSGTRFEDMYWIDLDTLTVIAYETDSKIEKKIIYSNATQNAIEKCDNILTIHSHPDSFPPSIDDLNSNYDHNYVIGIVTCHNGKVYLYSSNSSIDVEYYNLVIERFIKQGYNEDEAQIQTLNKLQKNFDIMFKEVTGNDCI